MTTPEAVFRTALAAGDILLQRCAACGAVHYYPGLACRACGSVRLERLRATGAGTVHAATTIAGDAPRNVAIVALVEGPHVLATLLPEALAVGTAVVARIVDAGSPRVVFEAAA